MSQDYILKSSTGTTTSDSISDSILDSMEKGPSADITGVDSIWKQQIDAFAPIQPLTTTGFIANTQADLFPLIDRFDKLEKNVETIISLLKLMLGSQQLERKTEKIKKSYHSTK